MSAKVKAIIILAIKMPLKTVILISIRIGTSELNIINFSFFIPFTPYEFDIFKVILTFKI